MTICELYPVSSPHNECTLAPLGASEQSHIGHVVYSAKLSDVCLLLDDDFDSFGMNTLVNHLDGEQVQRIERSIARLFAELADGISRIFSLRDDRSEAGGAVDLYFIATMLVKLRPADVSLFAQPLRDSTRCCKLVGVIRRADRMGQPSPT